MELLSELLQGVQDLEEAANTAYSKTLKPYHSYVVRGIYSVSKKMLTSNRMFSHCARTVPLKQFLKTNYNFILVYYNGN